MKVGTWNVNGIRARFDEVVAWADRERPDVFGLQEIKATPAQIPQTLFGLADYQSYWHGAPGGYSGVSLHVRRDHHATPRFACPPFDRECRIVEVELEGLVVASVYVPNGGKDFPTKLRFLESLRDHVGRARRERRSIVLFGDLNVARTDRDVYSGFVKKGAIGQRPDERALFDEMLAAGELIDVGRALEPDRDDLFTWWPPWREEKAKNRGWRIDFVLVTPDLFEGISLRVLKETGTSDHAPLVAEIPRASRS
jgi:exodeoxyribonuclease-3